MALSYEAEKLAFVSNLKGTSAGCVLVCLAHAPLAVLGLKMVQKRKRPLLQRDALFLVLPVLLNMTLLADYCYWTFVVFLGLVVAYVWKVESDVRRRKVVTLDAAPESSSSSSNSDKLSYLTLFKGLNMLITCLAILAVDFRVFPRRFAKTETFGVSLMDVGVGTFIVSSAVTSRYARGQGLPRAAPSAAAVPPLPTQQQQPNPQQQQRGGLSARWQRLAVLLLGVGRMLALKVVNYPEHVSEYGVHWNFFVTLFFVWTVSDALHFVCRPAVLPWLAVLMLAAYQFALLVTSLPDFMFAAPRSNFVYANREGILSLCGYVPMYLLAEALANRLFYRTSAGAAGQGSPPSAPASEPSAVASGTRSKAKTKTKAGTSDSSNKSTSSDSSSVNFADAPQAVPAAAATVWDVLGSPAQRRLHGRLAATCLVLWALWLAGSRLHQTSRRLANATFVLLSLALSFSLIFLLAIAEAVGDRTSTLASRVDGGVVGGAAHSHSNGHGREGVGGDADDDVAGEERTRGDGDGRVTAAERPSPPPALPPYPSTLPGQAPAAWAVPVRTLEYLNAHQLPVFLAANVATGVVNLSMRTIHTPHPAAFAILCVYATLVCGAAWAMSETISRSRTQ
jgi:phosphatidylinositol glycan class W